MDERLSALRAQLENQRHKYRTLRSVSSAQPLTSPKNKVRQNKLEFPMGPIWKSGGVGSLSAHAEAVLASKRQFLKIRSLDSVEYLGTIPTPASCKRRPDKIKPLPPRHAENPKLPPIRNPSATLGSTDPIRQTWAPLAKTLVSEQCDNPVQVESWTVPEYFSCGIPDTSMDVGTQPSRFELQGTRPARRMVSLQSVYQYDQAMPAVLKDSNQLLNETAATSKHNESAEDQPCQSNWWDGDYDEISEQLQFQSAVMKWRQETLKKDHRPATSASCSAGEINRSGDFHAEIEYSPGMSLMEKLLLRKLRGQTIS